MSQFPPSRRHDPARGGDERTPDLVAADVPRPDRAVLPNANALAIIADTPSKNNEPAAEGDFNWSADDSSIILREQPATAVYFNREGSLVIRQHRWPDDDTIIIIAASSIADFLDKLTDICGVPSVGKP